MALQVVGMLGPASCLLLAVSPAVGASPALASTLITVGLGLSALSLGGVSVSHLDIAPKHAGVHSTQLWPDARSGTQCRLKLCSHNLCICLLSEGVIFGAGNTAATLAGFISVPVTGYLLQVRTKLSSIATSGPLTLSITLSLPVCPSGVCPLCISAQVPCPSL